MSKVEVINTPNSDVPRDATEFGQQEGQPQEQGALVAVPPQVQHQEVPQQVQHQEVPQQVQHQAVPQQVHQEVQYYGHTVVSERTLRMANKRDLDFQHLEFGTHVAVGANCDAAEFYYQVQASHEETIAARTQARTEAIASRRLQKYNNQVQKVQSIIASERAKTRAMTAIGVASEAAARQVQESEALKYVLHEYGDFIGLADRRLATMGQIDADNQAVIQNSEFLRRFLKDKKDNIKSTKARKSTHTHVGKVGHSDQE